MEWHLANALERVADTVPERTALINNESCRTWRDYEDRAARLARVLDNEGIGPSGKVGLFMHNCNEYLESHFAALKLGASPININYRYRETELIHILDNSDSEALIFHEMYSEVIASVVKQCPGIKCLVQVSMSGVTETLLPGALRYEDAIGSATPQERIARNGDDVYMLYTGGTTGLPKGVMYSNGALCQQLMVAHQIYGMPVPRSIEELGESLKVGMAKSLLPTGLVACPLMHGTGIWVGALNPHLAGGAVVTISSLGLDPDLIWRLVQEHGVSYLTIVGDAFAKPLLKALDEAKEAGQPIDTASLRTIISSGVMWSQEVKDGLLQHADFTLIDAVGSSEAAMGSSITRRGSSSGTGKFTTNPGVRILSDDGHLLEPDSTEVGLLATPGTMIGYYKDPEKTRETIREIDGKHYIIPGDYAAYEPDGTIRLLGRGSTCINTAGEKVFPEEVEEAIKKHRQVLDCLVVGEPDERFGERVVAVVSTSAEVAMADLILHTKEHLASYKVPKEIFFADAIGRLPNGKPDYKWAVDYVSDPSNR